MKSTNNKRGADLNRKFISQHNMDFRGSHHFVRSKTNATVKVGKLQNSSLGVEYISRLIC